MATQTCHLPRFAQTLMKMLSGMRVRLELSLRRIIAAEQTYCDAGRGEAAKAVRCVGHQRVVRLDLEAGASQLAR